MKRPFKDKNKEVALVGFAPTTRHLAPYNVPGISVWGINEEYKYPDWFKCERPGAWFQLHPKWDFMRKNNRNDPGHWPWLQQPHPFPIIMQSKFTDVPSSIRFPIEEAIDKFGMYLTSSLAYELAAAILWEYETIHIYGYEMSHDSEYGDQRPCAEYLIGFAKGLGIKVVLPDACTLLRGDLYAYEDLRAANKTFLVQRGSVVKGYVSQSSAIVSEIKGKVDFAVETVKDPKAPVEVRTFMAHKAEALQLELLQATYEAGVQAGSSSEINNILTWHHKQSIANDRVEGYNNETPTEPKAD